MTVAAVLDYDARLARESARFAEALAAADPEASVPGCPDWTAADLAYHLGEVQTFWTYVLTHRPDPPAEYAEPVRPADRDELLAFVAEAAAGLRTALAAAEDREPAWTWFPPVQTVGFTRRRQTHEALVHRLDAEAVSGTGTAIDAELAADGVAEVLECMFSQAPTWAEVVWDGPIGTLEAIDTGDRWAVQVGSWSGISPRSGATQTDRPLLRLLDGDGGFDAAFSVTADADLLDRWLWNRPGGDVTLTGDAGAFAAVIRSGVQ